MGGKKGGAGENSKKAAGQARKADAAAGKKAAENAKLAVEEEKQWSKGSKSNAKKDDAEAKKAEAARKKAERDALLAEEEASQPAKAKGANAKTAQKKTRGLDLAQLDDEPTSKKGSALHASGIDNALDALSLTNKDTSKVERHPERRFKAAYAAFEARRMPEIEQENPGLRRQQRMDLCRKEFEKSEENPFNQVHVAVNASREEIAQVRNQERDKTEARLGK
ncbi:Coiled-coil domain-containing protein [Penicillium maclennaniae]|uniref:Coiled-coil domain-containing protein n=1 Tax=Penicillium maclennaniae TaxID=1343394 RepID=UPI00253FD2D6|nr:Coiled-coil domain-containing protein [Penicillium maclennaniae]KAJ5676658.1 Coiled-coil domain-containing protein [Penicillium maclennaniae]